MAETAAKFERRHYEAIRRANLAPAIGEVALQSENLEALKRRRKTELLSTLAEGIRPEQVRSVIDTHYTIAMENGQLVAEDGEPIANLLQRALEADKELAAEDEFFEPFLVRQTESEIAEFARWEAMARGETDFNTLITFSPYREEYDDGSDEAQEKLKRAAQKPYWRRGMFRVAHAADSGIHIYNYSIDNSCMDMMRQVARQELGYEFEAEDSVGMLGEPIKRQIDDDSWRFTAPRLVAASDRYLSEKHGGEWKHGYNPAKGVRGAQAFVESQTEIIDSLLSIDEKLALRHPTFESYAAAFEVKLYDGFALLETRLDSGREAEPVVDYEAASTVAGDLARDEGRSYDACGLLVSNSAERTVTTAQKTGFDSLLRLENRKISCYACKKKVVVPKGDLKNGKLSCRECGYWFDVCTGQKGFSKAEVSKPKAASAFDLMVSSFRRDGIMRRLRQLNRNYQSSTEELQKRRLQRNIKQETAELEETPAHSLAKILD